MVAIAMIVNATTPSSSDQAWIDIFTGAGHTVTNVLDSTITSGTDWSSWAVVVDRTAGNDYDSAHLPAKPILFGSRDLIGPLGIATSDGAKVSDTFDAFNSPWTSVAAGEVTILTEPSVLIYFTPGSRVAGTVIGAYNGPIGEGRVVAAYRVVSGHTRVFFGHLTGNRATGLYDDLLLESLDLAISGPSGTPSDPPTGAELDDHTALPDDLPVVAPGGTSGYAAGPYVQYPGVKHASKGVTPPEGYGPRIWQVPYPEGYPDPGSEMVTLRALIGEKR